MKKLWFYINWPFLKLYFAHGERARVIIQDTHGNWLLEQGKWLKWYGIAGLSLPGGGVKRGEEPAAAAIRELQEEIGLTIQPDDLKYIGQTIVCERGLSYSAKIFMTTLAVHPEIQLDRREVVTAGWYRVADLPDHHIKPDVAWALNNLVK